MAMPSVRTITVACCASPVKESKAIWGHMSLLKGHHRTRAWQRGGKGEATLIPATPDGIQLNSKRAQLRLRTGWGVSDESLYELK